MDYIIVELDTTAPTIEIYAPAYTTREASVEVTIDANETLGTQNEIYIIDENGNRHDYTFDRFGNQMVGVIDFNGFPLGLARLFVRVRDEVDNVSELYEKVITIRESLTILSLDISDSKKSNIQNKDIERKAETIEKNRPLTITSGKSRTKE
ncbi:putative Ig-like domain-containing protein [Bacillus phage Kirov]|uniref:Putative Ig-like domain-containing protein n=1 Tax=Bacillus phage Kirov TaxID=2783539 RepID=A0A7U3NJS6_9CAUD|nr:putative Ig-like domain-containing protein [Bacillus phage Kirov]QOV08260.1 putative Ig-like domain-containing protein [Bacillus phage Kirov]